MIYHRMDVGDLERVGIVERPPCIGTTCEDCCRMCDLAGCEPVQEMGKTVTIPINTSVFVCRVENPLVAINKALREVDARAERYKSNKTLNRAFWHSWWDQICGVDLPHGNLTPMTVWVGEPYYAEGGIARVGEGP